MHHLFLHEVGPIKECSIDISNNMVLTGAQASGKSTIAKSIFFFRSLKDDILDLILRKNLLDGNISLSKTVTRQLRNKFLQIFGTSRAMDSSMKMRYDYSEDTYVEITLRLNEGYDYISPNYVYFTFSKTIKDFFARANTQLYFSSITKEECLNQLNELFCDDKDTIFIPAGRSLITLLTTQLNYIFTTMSEDQKRSIDYCTQKYIEKILMIRSSFNEGIIGYYEQKKTLSLSDINSDIISSAMMLIDKILKGRYSFFNGEERLNLDFGKYVKINYTSSGQQESVWIFNILMYQLINNSNTFIILEEPEAHLYPDAQKSITELLSLFNTSGNSTLITTHSPYILGTINNLLYAHSLNMSPIHSRIESIIPEILQSEKCDAYYVCDGKVDSCNDEDGIFINNDVIDGASHEINDEFDNLLACENMEE